MKYIEYIYIYNHSQIQMVKIVHPNQNVLRADDKTVNICAREVREK